MADDAPAPATGTTDLASSTSTQAPAITPNAGEPGSTEVVAPGGESFLGAAKADTDDKGTGDGSDDKSKTDAGAAEGAEAPTVLSAADYKIEFPEGVSVDEGLLGEFQTFAAEQKLTLEQAQNLSNLYVKGLEAASKQFLDAQTATWTKTIDAWKGDIAADTVIGSGHEAEVQQVLGAALDAFGTPETRAALDATAAGWNPHIIKFVYNMAQALVEGTPLESGGPRGKAGNTLGTTLYPTG